MTANSDPNDTVTVCADHTVAKHVGNWTTSRSFQFHSIRGSVVLDLCSRQIPTGDVELKLDIDRGVLKLLVSNDANIDHATLAGIGRGCVKDLEGPHTAGGPRLRLTGCVQGGEIRGTRSGTTILSAMGTRAYVDDVTRTHAPRRRDTHCRRPRPRKQLTLRSGAAHACHHHRRRNGRPLPGPST